MATTAALCAATTLSLFFWPTSVLLLVGKRVTSRALWVIAAADVIVAPLALILFLAARG